MTRKDYELIAAVLKAQRSGYWQQEGDRDSIVQALADALAGDNPRFDRDRFIKAAES